MGKYERICTLPNEVFQEAERLYQEDGNLKRYIALMNEAMYIAEGNEEHTQWDTELGRELVTPFADEIKRLNKVKKYHYFAETDGK